MDPALQELLNHHDSDTEVEALIKLDSTEAKLPGVRIISRFGVIATCRLKKSSITDIHEEESVVSLKATRLISPEPAYDDDQKKNNTRISDTDIRRPEDLTPTGKGIVVAAIDWGLDFNNPAFKNKDGSTRLIALWDQRGNSNQDKSNRYGYGNIYTREDINHALAQTDPYTALGYHPGDADPHGTGSHGTHVMDIAAGNGLGGSPESLAKESDLVFVHLADRNTTGLANLGNSVRILEAVDFICVTAAALPCVINLSVGRHGGPHDGSTLCEQAFDNLLREVPGRMIVQSGGNYFDKGIHAAGKLRKGETHVLEFAIHENDPTPNELEVWYSGKDIAEVCVVSPSGNASAWVRLKGKAELAHGRDIIGRIYHRACDPNNGDHQIDLFLYEKAEPGKWRLCIRAIEVHHGEFHAWLERDDLCPACQSRFTCSEPIDPFYTTGSLANATLPLVVGAYDRHHIRKEISAFSSAGPTRDSRNKPDLVAPGVSVLAARSSPRRYDSKYPLLTRKSGTSMAAPHVTSVVAICFEMSPHLWSHQIKKIIVGECDPVDTGKQNVNRYGAGYLNVSRIINALRNKQNKQTHHAMKTIAEKDRTENSVMGLSLIKDARAIYRSVTQHDVLPGMLASLFSILARPGEVLKLPVEAGDVLLRIALGEPGFEHVSVLADKPVNHLHLNPEVRRESCLPGIYCKMIEHSTSGSTGNGSIARRVLDAHGRVPLGQLLLRPRKDQTQPAGEADPISIAGLGIAVFGIVSPYFSGGDFQVESCFAKFAREKIPSYMPEYFVEHKFMINAYGYSSDEQFWFKIECKFTGEDINLVSITPLKQESSTLVKSTFEIKFQAEKKGGASPEITFAIAGNWDPAAVIPAQSSFTGNIDINTKGEITGHRISSEKNWVTIKKWITGKPHLVKESKPEITPIYIHSVFFAIGSYALNDKNILDTEAWLTKLPPGERTKIETGDLIIELTGYTSATGNIHKNQVLGRRRVESVRKFLKDRFGNTAKFRTTNNGEIAVKTNDGKENANERRVDIVVGGTLRQ
jgi:subtilisin family serine protease/outer membrane protein OmpA-like peptidoglycan-associated protein